MAAIALVARADSFVLPHYCIENIILYDGTWVDFFNGLSVNDRPKLRDSHVIDLLSNPDHVDTQKVTIIKLHFCTRITDDSLVFIADNFPQLEKLWINRCGLFTDKGINAISEKCRKLRFLDYSFCSKVTDEALNTIVSNLPLLENLSAECCNISVLPDDFGDRLQHLKWLNLRSNKITTLPESVHKLASLRSCRTLDFKDNQITEQSVRISQNPSIKIDTLNSSDMFLTADNNTINQPELPTQGHTFEGCASCIMMNCQKKSKCVLFLTGCTNVLIIVFFIVASICMYYAIQKQLIVNGVDPMKQFNVIDSNCIIVEVNHIVNGRQKRCETKNSSTVRNCGCEDIYLYLFSLPLQRIESTDASKFEIESETNVYQSIEHVIERGARSCQNSDGPVDPYFDVGQETRCWRPSLSESETETQPKLPDAYKCGNDLCLKVLDPQNDADVVHRDQTRRWTVVGGFYGAMVFMCFVSGSLHFFLGLSGQN